METVIWKESAPPLAPQPQLRTTENADVVVVGAGYCGLSAALELASNGISVVVLEAQEPGFGASGRNAGHCCPDWIFYDPKAIERRFGQFRGERINMLQAGAADLVFSLIRAHNISCGAVQTGTINVVRHEKGMNAFEDRCEQWRKRSARVELLDRRAIRRHIKTDNFAGGLLFKDGGHLNPLAFSRGLASATLKRGGRIYYYSPAINIEKNGTDWIVETPGGSIQAKKLLLATNAHRGDLWPGLDRSFYRIPSMGVATDPIAKNIRDSVLPENNSVAEHMGRNFFFRFDEDGRLSMGGVVGWNVYSNIEKAQQSLGHEFELVFPQIGTVRFKHYWRGMLDMSPNKIVGVHELAKNLFAVIGFSGRGVPTATAIGRDVARMLIDGDPDVMAFPLTPLPHAICARTVSFLITHAMLPFQKAFGQNS